MHFFLCILFYLFPLLLVSGLFGSLLRCLLVEWLYPCFPSLPTDGCLG